MEKVQIVHTQWRVLSFSPPSCSALVSSPMFFPTTNGNEGVIVIMTVNVATLYKVCVYFLVSFKKSISLLAEDKFYNEESKGRKIRAKEEKTKERVNKQIG